MYDQEKKEGQQNSQLSVVWDGYFNSCTGWASEAISYVTNLQRVFFFISLSFPKKRKSKILEKRKHNNIQT